MATGSIPPQRDSYDVVIVGGAMLGTSLAWWLSDSAGFDGSVLVVERDPSYEWSATAHTNSCIRQQFSQKINVEISRFGAEFIRNFRSYMGDDPRVPEITLQSFGYMYLAATESAAEGLRRNQKLQAECGAATRFMSPEEIGELYPFYNLEDIIGANHNRVDEGYFDGNTIFDWWKRRAREGGVEYIANEVVGMSTDAAASRVQSVTLKTGEVITCGTVVNAAGPRAAGLAAMAGINIPVEPRRRFTFVFDAAKPLERDLPLTVDPSGVHVRSDGRYYMAGCPPTPDPAVVPDDFTMDHNLWEDLVWPAVANRIPQFEAIKLIQSWVGHYDYNTLDQNAIIGPHEQVENFLFLNGFSGHGFQQSPAMGRGLAEWITYGAYRSLDLSPFGYARIAQNRPMTEQAVI